MTDPTWNHDMGFTCEKVGMCDNIGLSCGIGPSTKLTKGAHIILCGRGFSWVIHRFQNDSLLFNRNWTEYKLGFGFLSQEFWIGNDKLSFLTNQNTYELRIDVTSTDGLSFYVTYSKFRISDEYSEYKLTSVGEYKGTEANVRKGTLSSLPLSVINNFNVSEVLLAGVVDVKWVAYRAPLQALQQDYRL
ncbi:Fibrinogen-like protein A [Holothuria leucospilota]|uniref:Fibrinogen-like protein A n=1 Tax=Holothuria leucospilota TaxID=206669 RepID=A0A9Q0Y959_HOLLE|nr:Fibrinogen-like protein A [Holothuria leucospilota]